MRIIKYFIKTLRYINIYIYISKIKINFRVKYVFGPSSFSEFWN